MGLFNCRSISIFFLFFLCFAIDAFADEKHDAFIKNTNPTLKEVADEITRDAQDTIDLTKGNLKIGEDVAKRYASDGSEFQKGKGTFKDHPWKEGNPNWKNVFMKDDYEAMSWWKNEESYGIFNNTCFQHHIISKCDSETFLVGYWWPEAIVEVSDYCIGALLGPPGTRFAGKCRKEWLDLKKANFDPKIIADWEAKSGKEVKFPDGLREDPHIGHSWTDDSGSYPGQKTRFYEAHLIRPWLDIRQKEPEPETCKPPINPRKEACFNDICLPPARPVGEQIEDKTDVCPSDTLRTPLNPRSPKHWSEDMTENDPLPAMPFLWRLPELSVKRVENAIPEYVKLWNGVPEFATQIKNLDELQNNTCASWRSHPDVIGGGNRYGLEFANGLGWRYPMDEIWKPGVDLGIQPNNDERLQRNCLTSQGTQVYPLVGDIESNSERVGAVAAARRMLEWSSWEKFPDVNRTNHMSDFYRQNIYRLANTDSYYLSKWMPDKMQRVFPLDSTRNPSECFIANQIDSIRSPRIWPKGINAYNYEGVVRFAFWNYRTCCVGPIAGPNPTELPQDLPAVCVAMSE